MRYLFLVAIIIVGCFEGPVGPQGEKGEQGVQGVEGNDNGLEMVELKGTLLPAEKLSSCNCWVIKNEKITTDALISVYANKLIFETWEIPKWAVYESESMPTLNIQIFDCEQCISYANGSYKIFLLKRNP